MASLFERAGSPYLWMRFTVKGKRYQESTEQKTKPKARKVMDKRVEQLKGFGGVSDLADRLLVAIASEVNPDKRKQMRKEIAARILSDEVDAVTLEDAFPAFRKKPRKRNPAEATMDSYERIWNAFVKWMGTNHPHIARLHEVTPQTAESYMDELWAGNITQRTYNWKLTLLRDVFKRMALEGNVTINPFAHIELMQLMTESRQNLTDRQVDGVLAKATGELRMLILIGCYTGLRHGDAVRLKWSDIDMKERVINLMPHKTAKLKKVIKFHIHKVLLEELMQLKRNRTYVVPDLRKTFDREHTAVSDQVKKLFESAGIKVHGKRHDGRGQVACLYSFHSLRHTFVTNCQKAGVPQQVVAELVGHGSTVVTKIYTHTDAEQLRDAVDSLGDVRVKTEASA